jgi:hypothetical protein
MGRCIGHLLFSLLRFLAGSFAIIGALMRQATDGSRRHCERSEAIQCCDGEGWIASSLRSSQ